MELSPEEYSLLSKGLKFAPQPPRINRFDLTKDLEAFERRLRLREFFYDPEDNDKYDPEKLKFKEKSAWNPPKNRDPALEAYIRAVEDDAWHLTSLTRRKDNLTPQNREALTSLRSSNDIVINLHTKAQLWW